MSDSPGKRLASFRNSLGMNQREFATSLGLSSSAVAFIESDSRTPSKGFLIKISDRYRISADWLLHGIGEMQMAEIAGFAGRQGRIEPADTEKPAHGDFRFDGEEFAMIRRMDLSVSAGRGLVPTEGGEAEALAFSRSWLLRNSINADLSVLVRVSGDSMSPGIPHGALVLVHLPELRADREGVYAFNRGDASFIKRLIPSGVDASGRPTTLVILSDNPAYPPEVVSGSDMNDIRVIGRVRCVMTTL